MEESTVMTTAEASASAETSAPAPANVFAFAPEEGSTSVFAFAPEEVGQGDAATEDAEQGGEEAPAEDANGQGSGGDGQQLEGKPQKDVGKAFAKATERQRLKFEQQLANDPDRAIGRRLVEDLMQREHLSEADARKTLDDRWAAAYAKRAGVTEEIARDIISLKQGKNKPTEATDIDPEARAGEVTAEIAAMDLPEGFDPAEAFKDRAFAELLVEYPTAAAVRIYAAEHAAKVAKGQADNAAQDIAEKLRARGQIPAPATPRAPVQPRVNWSEASDDDFWAEKERREKAMR